MILLLGLLCILPQLLLSSSSFSGTITAASLNQPTAGETDSITKTESSTEPYFNGLQQLGDMWSQLWNRQQKKEGSEDASKGVLGDFSIIPESDIRDKSRTIWIITTACLPWMTGTSINPLLRAAYLAKDRPAGKIHLMVPWLEKEEQAVSYPAIAFSSTIYETETNLY